MTPKFSTLIVLTLITAVVLVPFAISDLYLPMLRNQAFGLLDFSRTDLYKQTTGFMALAFVLFEMILTLRKRGRRWRIAIPGSMWMWRSLHIFLGVGLIAMILIHTWGATGSNYNAIFLWVFFGVSLSALVGVVAETGILESPYKYFRLVPFQLGSLTKVMPQVSKGPLIRGLRLFWLSTHIILVCIFIVMLGFHIFLAYYFQ